MFVLLGKCQAYMELLTIYFESIVCGGGGKWCSRNDGMEGRTFRVQEGKYSAAEL